MLVDIPADLESHRVGEVCGDRDTPQPNPKALHLIIPSIWSTSRFYLLTFPPTSTRVAVAREPVIKHKLHTFFRTEAAPDDRAVDPGAVIAEASDVPADRTIDPVVVAALDADLAADVIVLNDLSPHPATGRGHMVVNHVDPSLFTDLRVGPPPVDGYNSLAILIISLYRRIAFQADLANSYEDLMTAKRIQERRGNEIEQELRGWAEIASPFVQFVQ